MTTASRLALAASTVLATALLVAGCATSPGSSAPTSSADPNGAAPDDANTAPTEDDVEAAWLDDGRMFAIVTWGSSTCVPVVDEVTAEGQTVTVALVDAPSEDGSQKACTDDLSARASIGAVPEGVDPTRDVEFIVTAGDRTDDVDLDGSAALTGTPGGSTEYAPSAGRFDDDGVVLLTWGSSSCPPIVEGVEESADGATVTFTTEDRACTMDMAPRATIIGLTGDSDDDREFALTLVGDDLDATVPVLKG